MGYDPKVSSPWSDVDLHPPNHRFIDDAHESALQAIEALELVGPSWEKEFADMTLEQARHVRRFRVDDEDSWRGTARACARIWRMDWGGNQIAGMDLCRRAAPFFGEDWNAKPWN